MELLPPSGIKQKAQEGISLLPNYAVNPKTFTVGESSSITAKEKFFAKKRKVTFVIGETEGVHQFISYLASEFIGENWFEIKEENRIKEKRRARLAIEKLTICKMCYINEYTCEFQKYYYQYFDSDEKMDNISQLYYMKLPEPWNLKLS